MHLHRLLAQSLDLAEFFQRARRAAGQFDRLAVGAQHVVRQAVAVRSFTAPLHDPGVAGRLNLVQLAHQLGECGVGGTGRRRRTGRRVRQRRQLWSRRRAVEHAGLQVHRAAHAAVVAEKVRFCPQHFAIGQVATQRAVVEQTGARIQRHGDDADFAHGCAHCARSERRQVLRRDSSSPRRFLSAIGALPRISSRCAARPVKLAVLRHRRPCASAVRRAAHRPAVWSPVAGSVSVRCPAFPCQYKPLARLFRGTDQQGSRGKTSYSAGRCWSRRRTGR